MNKEVNFEIAKLLKDKGFDESTSCFYTKPNSKMFGIDEHGRYYPIKNKAKSLWITGNAAALHMNNVYFAPTIAEVVMWLYEKHGIWINVDIGMTGFYGHYKVNPQNTLPSNLKQGWANDQDNPAKSITEAYEAAIKYALENLI